MEEQAVSAEAVADAADGGVGDAPGAGDLTEGGAADELVEDVGQEVGTAQPVGGGEGGGGESSSAA